jgi:hypothetical protein
LGKAFCKNATDVRFDLLPSLNIISYKWIRCDEDSTKILSESGASALTARCDDQDQYGVKRRDVAEGRIRGKV